MRLIPDGATRRLAAAPALAMVLMVATPLQAQLIDLNLNDSGVAACVPAQNNSASFGTTAGVSEQILALTSPVGQNVFWELAATAGFPTTVSCTPTTTGSGFVTSFTCANGLTVSLPAGATDVASVSSSQPVTVTAPTTASLGTVQFSLTGTIDGGGFESCQNFYTVDLLQPKQAFDLVFVLDKSGSMGSSSGAGTRWGALKTGVLTFLPFIEQAAGGDTPAGSRVGVTFFDTSVNASSTAMFDVLSGGNPSASFANIPTLLNLTPGGWTAMGQGLSDGMTKANNASRPRVVVLFSDGEQNIAPMIAESGCAFVSPATPINPPDCPATSGHKIVTIGIGNPSGTYLSTLENLGGNNRGASLITDNGSTFTGVDAVPSDIGATFQNSIGAALESNSPQSIANFSGKVQPDPAVPGVNALEPFQVNRGAEAVMLSFAFSRDFETPDLLKLVAGMRVTRDGADVLGDFQPRIYGNYSGVITLVANDRMAGSKLRRDLSGEYRVSLSLPPKMRPDLEFRLFAFAEERRLRIAGAPDVRVQKVNDTVDVSVQLDYQNRAIEDADVVVRVFTPGADMGDTLSAGDPVELSGADDAGSPGVQKYDQLVAGDPGFLDRLKLSPNAITMTHQGNGRYTGSFRLPDTVGVVHFVYDVSARNDALFGRLQRHWYESVYARFDTIDLDASELSWSMIDGALVLDATFRRPSGRLLGPGFGSSIRFDGGGPAEALDRQNGSYRFTFADGTTAETPIEVTLLGDTIYSGPAGWGIAAGGHDWLTPPKLYWLLLALLLLILIVVWRRRGGA